MAEAHSAAALSFSLTHDGVSVSYDQELLRDFWHGYVRGLKRRYGRFNNHFRTGVFPGNPLTLAIVVGIIAIFSAIGVDVTLGLVPLVQNYVLWYIFGDGLIGRTITLMLASAFAWFLLVQALRLSMKALLTYKGWMYESPGKPISTPTKLWLGVLAIVAKAGPMLHSFQGALPRLPLPSLDETVAKHLRSMKPILSEKEFEELETLSEKFRRGVGRRLQRYLMLKSYLSINYITDWWEEFVYMRQRTPLMINSNYYGMDSINEFPTTIQAARAANITWAALQFRRKVERQEVSPFSIAPRTKVPFCTMQYERLFNACRLPGEEVDRFAQWDDAKHIAVYCRGAWFKVVVHNGKRLLDACELQFQFDEILSQEITVSGAEGHVAVLTAGERKHWAETRKEHFSSGINKTSLRTIERAAFCVILDDDVVGYEKGDMAKLDAWAHNLLHGKAYDRWFDKSFNIIISKNAHFGINTEHSWGDAAVTAHFVEFILLKDVVFEGYDEAGNTKGEPRVKLHPERLKWAITEPCEARIEQSLTVANALIADVEMALLAWDEFGKGLVKKLKCSPDAFMQMTLQLTYFRNQGKFSLTYEASMTRLFREGRTETVRSCTVESADFVRVMVDPSVTREERVRLLRVACEKHQDQYRDAMTGRGVDRHLFGLYVIKRYLEEESPFFDRIFPPTYLLSTSQTPLNQCDDEGEMKHLTTEKKLKLVSAGGGFGPVADAGYGVSYVISGEDHVTFHISSKRSAPNTSSAKFREDLMQSLRDMRALFVERKPSIPK